MTGLLLLLGALAILGGVLVLTEVADQAIDNRFPAYGRLMARAFGEHPELPLSHVRTSTSPDEDRSW